MALGASWLLDASLASLAQMLALASSHGCWADGEQPPRSCSHTFGRRLSVGASAPRSRLHGHLTLSERRLARAAAPAGSRLSLCPQYALYKKMTQAAILIQSKFRSYYEQKRFQQSRRAAVLIQQYYRSYKEYERLKQASRGAAGHNPKIK